MEIFVVGCSVPGTFSVQHTLCLYLKFPLGDNENAFPMVWASAASASHSLLIKHACETAAVLSQSDISNACTWYDMRIIGHHPMMGGLLYIAGLTSITSVPANAIIRFCIPLVRCPKPLAKVSQTPLGESLLGYHSVTLSASQRKRWRTGLSASQPR